MRLFTFLGLFFCAATLSYGQNLSEDEKKGAQFHKEYNFEQAIHIYNRLLEQTSDSAKRESLQNLIMQSENGRSLLEFAFEPSVVAKKSFAKSTFFLHYPGFPDKSWCSAPKSLLPDAQGAEFPVVHYPSGSGKILFSAPDNSGSWNIYVTRQLNDTLWSTPEILGGNLVSMGNELFPILCNNEKTLYFSSNGHSGVGGYDLYVSNWDEESNDWSVPQNLGFPYSSPQDDFLFYNTPDGLYTLFASNRDCHSDSLMVYALDFENVPLKKAITSEEAARIAVMNLAGTAQSLEADNNQESKTEESLNNEDIGKYSAAVDNVRKLQQQVKEAIERQSANRNLYNSLTNPDDLIALEKQIAKQEIETMQLQNEANEAVMALQRIEIEFLSKGIFVSQDDVAQKPENGREEIGGKGFAFADMSMGKMPYMSVLVPEPEIDLSFRICDTAQLVDLAEFPKELTFQIQLYTLTKKASVKALKGLSPVFERKTSGGKYTYSVGIFDSYKDAVANLNMVKKRGFPSAVVTAYNEGKMLNITKARALEKELAESAVYQVVVVGYPEGMPQNVLTVIRTSTEKDIAKAVDAGVVKYLIGPFGKASEAEELAVAIRVVSDKQISVEKVEK